MGGNRGGDLHEMDVVSLAAKAADYLCCQDGHGWDARAPFDQEMVLEARPEIFSQREAVYSIDHSRYVVDSLCVRVEEYDYC